jgi:riboflavin synthase
MFTGIIEEVGRLLEMEPRSAGSRLRIAASHVTSDLNEGDSVSVNGVCLTAVAIRPGSFGADASPETLERSTLGSLAGGSPLNLERALRPQSRLGGHIVQGHVDGVGRVVSVEQLGDDNWWLRVQAPPELDRYLVFKGSVAIDGISLTIARIEDGILAVTIIPHTWSNTNLRGKRPGDTVNLETDVLAKYVEKMLASIETKPKKGLTVEDLREQGY